MRVAMLTPLPPARTGIAHYSAMLLPALRERLDIEAFDEKDMTRYRRDAYDAVFYQLGNNPHHEFIYREAVEHPGIAVLHDMVLHHLIVEMTLARGDVEAYVESLRASHGEAGAAWARGRAVGLHTEMGNFLLPASVDVANRSRAVIVHNRYARERLQSLGVTTPIHVVPHPHDTETSVVSRAALRRRFGFEDRHRVIGVFGFLTSAKRADVVLEAFRIAQQQDSSLRLLIAGEPAPDIDVTSIAGPGIVVTGYVPDDELSGYFEAADRLVNLRYPTAGETSGTLIRAIAAGKPVAVSDYAQFAELPDGVVVKIPLGRGEVEALVRFLLDELDLSAGQREWIVENAALASTVEGYVQSLTPLAGSSGAVTQRLPLLAEVTLLSLEERDGSLVMRLRNDGRFPLRARVYGEPAYRLVLKLSDGTREVQNRWIELPHDVGPGAEATISIPLLARAPRLTATVYHALEGLPMLDSEPIAVVELALVR